MPSTILTDGATFTCAHHGTGTVATGIVISALAADVTIGGHKPILAGATISATPFFAGCIFADTHGPNPCTRFTLPAPSEQTLTIGGKPVYTAADATAIAAAPSSGNGQPGLTISEPQTLVTA
jgi:hypothetical protein